MTPVPEERPSPNFDARVGPPWMAVLHYTGMRTGEEALARLTDPAAKVSSHYVVEEDGRVFRLVPEARRAWHAGAAYWRGERDVNGVSIGIEIVNPGHEHGYRPFPEAQIAAVIALLDAVRSRWTIEDRDVVGHSDVAPERKEDPGELFPWARLSAAGHGLWSEAPAAPGGLLQVGDEGLPVAVLQGALARLGFETPADGVFSPALAVRVRAFQRHWRPGRIDGVADGETRARLAEIVRLSRKASPRG